jgi:hypothetical protein
MWLEYSFWRIFISGGEPTMVEYCLEGESEIIKNEGNKLLTVMGFNKLEIANWHIARMGERRYVGLVVNKFNGFGI